MRTSRPPDPAAQERGAGRLTRCGRRCAAPDRPRARASTKRPASRRPLSGKSSATVHRSPGGSSSSPERSDGGAKSGPLDRGHGGLRSLGRLHRRRHRRDRGVLALLHRADPRLDRTRHPSLHAPTDHPWNLPDLRPEDSSGKNPQVSAAKADSPRARSRPHQRPGGSGVPIESTYN